MLTTSDNDRVPYTLAPHAAAVTSEITVKHSRFLTALRRAEQVEEAQRFIEERRHAHPDARHHCSAYVIGSGPVDRIERSSDDGEPGGTAGIPMLQVVKTRDLVDIVVVVTRYFGGIKLGAGGLVRAYSGAVTAVLDRAPLVRRERRELHTLTVEHAEAGRIESELRRRGVIVVDTAYAESTVLTLAAADSAQLVDLVAAVTSGTGTLDPAGELWVDT